MNHYELANTTNVLIAEITDKKMKQKHIAITYKLAMMSSEKTDWQKVNYAIIERWGLNGLQRIKNKAHK